MIMGLGAAIAYTKGMRGKEMVVGYGVWSALPGLIGDGFGFFFWCCRSKVGMAVSQAYRPYEEL